MRMVNIMQCKNEDCQNNVNNDCTLEAIVIGHDGTCEDEELEEEE